MSNPFNLKNQIKTPYTKKDRSLTHLYLSRWEIKPISHTNSDREFRFQALAKH